MGGVVIPLRVDEPTLHQATVRYLRSRFGQAERTETLNEHLRQLGLVDAHGKPSILVADEDERRELFRWLTDNTRPVPTIVVTRKELELV